MLTNSFNSKFMKSKHQSSISNENLSTKLRYAANVLHLHFTNN